MGEIEGTQSFDLAALDIDAEKVNLPSVPRLEKGRQGQRWNGNYLIGALAFRSVAKKALLLVVTKKSTAWPASSVAKGGGEAGYGSIAVAQPVTVCKPASSKTV